MKQPLMIMPPAQAEILSDTPWTDAAGNSSPRDTRFTPLRWLDDDLPDETLLGSGTPPRELLKIRSRMRAA